MRCFLGCFGGRRHHRRQKPDHSAENKLYRESEHPDDRSPTVGEIQVTPVTEICENCSPSPTKKRVTFDSKVETYEPVVLQESLQLLEKRSSFDDGDDENINHATSHSSGLYPSNHRYKNCRESDDDVDEDDDEKEEDEIAFSESDLDEDEEYYSDDGFGENELHGKEIDAKPRGVLNPIENLTQWKCAKSKGKTIQNQTQKENVSFHLNQGERKDFTSLGTEPQIDDTSSHGFKHKSRTEPKKPRSQKLTVDASFSSWLSTSETTSDCNSVSKETLAPEKHSSSCVSKPTKSSPEDRPILCALPLEEIEQFPATSTPSKSPSKSPDDTPIVGTVGGYWGSDSKTNDDASASSFKGIPNTTSKYREDNKVKWHSTPFEARLEKALNKTETDSFNMCLLDTAT